MHMPSQDSSGTLCLMLNQEPLCYLLKPPTDVQAAIASSLRHPNVVLMLGYCLEPPCIITEFCPRGSLFDVLKKANTDPVFAQQLSWCKRIQMALDAAKVGTETYHTTHSRSGTMPCCLFASTLFVCCSNFVSDTLASHTILHV